MKIQKNNIFVKLVHTGIKDGKYNAWPELIPAGYMPNDEIVKYHQKLDTTPIPQDSCLYNMYVQFYKKYITNGMSNQTPMEWERSFEYRLQIEFCNPGKCGKCDLSYNPLAHCFENLKNGLCRDKYAILVIGAVFFPEKYQKNQGR